MDYQDGGAILYRLGIFPFTGKFLEEIGPVSIATRLEAQEKHSCFVLAHRFGERHPLTPKHRTKCTLVFHCPPRAWSRILLQSLQPAGSSLFAPDGRCPWISRRCGRVDFAGFKSGAVSASARNFAQGFQA